MTSSAYIDGLTLLARRELSEAQVRERLARRGHVPETIDAAVERLKRERAIDDVRAAESIARTEAGVKHHGKLRVRHRLEQSGIAPATARRVVADMFGGIDDQALLEAALVKRLRDGAAIADDREFQKLYRYLIGQGFEPDNVLRVLTARRVRP